MVPSSPRPQKSRFVTPRGSQKPSVEPRKSPFASASASSSALLLSADADFGAWGAT